MGIFDEAEPVDDDEVALDFGKYAGMTPLQVFGADPSYIVWLYENVTPKRCSEVLYMDAVESAQDAPFDHEDPWFAEVVRK